MNRSIWCFLSVINRGWLKSHDHFHALPSLIPLSLLEHHPLCPDEPYQSSHSGNYANGPRLLSRLFYRTTWSAADNAHVILCNVAARTVTSLPVWHFWTSNLFWGLGGKGKCFNNQLHRPLMDGAPGIKGSHEIDALRPPAAAAPTAAFKSHLRIGKRTHTTTIHSHDTRWTWSRSITPL